MELDPDHRYFWEQIHGLFGSILVIDRDLRITYASDQVVRHMPALEAAPGLLDAFSVQRPGRLATFEDALEQIGSLFLLIAADESFALRGQVIRYNNQGQEVLIFCGAPWLFWLTANRPDLRLGLADFSPQDVQLDQLFYMSTEKNMIADLESLNAELKLAKEQLEDAHEAKNAFFAQMSHEMRTPLNGVVSALALLREQRMTEDARDILDLARSSSSNLLRVINYVLDVAKIEAAEDIEERPFALEDLITFTSEIVSARAMEKSIDLRTSINPALCANYRGDPDRLQQTLLNLVINAIKFTDEGSISIEVLPATAPDYTVRFEVNDTVIGIPKKDHIRIFEPFFSTATGAAGTRDQGTGLGLDIVRRNAEVMGGRVGVSSAPGTGSSFWLELPLAESTESEAPRPAAPQAEATAKDIGAINAHLMLVDDNETNLMLGTMVFESLGITVTPVSSGEEAVQRADPAVHDLIFMDISMPGMDGYEATRAIRLQYDEQSLPVVALSAYASSVERNKASEAGMNGYLTKPMQQHESLAVLRKFLPAARFGGKAKAAGGDAKNTASLVDTATLDALRAQIGDTNLKTVIDKFQDEARKRWAALTAAGDHDSRAREAHTLASTCASFGLPPAADALRKIEERAKQATPEAADSLAQAGDLLDQSLADLDAILAQP